MSLARREREREKMQRRILDAAKTLFLREGFDNVSMRRIAAAIEYSPAALYRYFSNKREILSALRNEAFGRFAVRQRKLAEEHADPIKRLRAGGMDYVRFALEEPDNFHLMFSMSEEKVSLGGEHAECAMESFGLFATNVQECLDAGHFGERSLDEILYGLWSGVHGLAHLLITGQMQALSDGINVEQLVDKILDFNMRPA